MPKLLHTLCCCIVRPNAKDYLKAKGYKHSNLENDKGTPTGTVNPTSIITQVTRNEDVPNSILSDAVKARMHGFNGNLRSGIEINNNSKSIDNTPVTDSQTTVNALIPASSPISVTSPMPTEQFVLNGTSAAIADFKEKEKYKDSLLPEPHAHDQHKKCLIVDLDETLVHSSFKPVKNADFIIPVEIDNVVHQVYVLKRPYADEFLERIGKLFECVLFTASLAKYADPVADLLDKQRTFRSRLFREDCVLFGKNYVKDLDRLGRDLQKVVIIDNSPASYAFHPENALPVRTWFDDPHDCELLDIIPLLEELAESSNIYEILQRRVLVSNLYGYNMMATITTFTETNNNNNSLYNNYNNKEDRQNNNNSKRTKNNIEYDCSRNNNNNNYNRNTLNKHAIMTTAANTTITSSSSMPNTISSNVEYGSAQRFNTSDKNNNRSTNSNNYRRQNNKEDATEYNNNYYNNHSNNNNSSGGNNNVRVSVPIYCSSNNSNRMRSIGK